MSVRIVASRFIFGVVVDKPKLPKGFQLKESRRDFLQAERESDGKLFYVTREGLVPVRRVSRRDVRRTNGRLKLGKTFADMNPRHRIKLII